MVMGGNDPKFALEINRLNVEVFKLIVHDVYITSYKLY